MHVKPHWVYFGDVINEGTSYDSINTDKGPSQKIISPKGHFQDPFNILVFKRDHFSTRDKVDGLKVSFIQSNNNINLFLSKLKLLDMVHVNIIFLFQRVSLTSDS